jgi:PST family polysaccharide transporter
MVSGARWMSVNQVVVQVTRLAVQVVMARLLDPQAFGLMAMALVVLLFLEIVRGFGTGMAVVQRREVGQDLLSSIFFFNIVLGVATTALMALAAPGIAAVYGDRALAPVLQVLCLSLLMMSAGDLQQWLLRRDMKFAAVAAANIVGAVLGGVCSVILGVMGYGVWALVIGNVVGFAVAAAIAWVTSPWRPSAHFRLGDVRQVIGFSANLSAFNIFNFFLLNGDKIIVGRFLGAGPLGFYGLAQRVLMYPVTSISVALQEVMFAGLSRVQDDHAVFRQTYFRACAVTAMICFPATAVLAVVASDAVLVVLGEQWRPLVPLIWILAPVGGIQSVSFSVGVIYNAKGRSDLLLRWGIFSGLLVLGSYFAGLPWGVIGVAATYSATMVLLLIPGFAIPFRLVDARLRDLVKTLWPYVWATGATAVAVTAAREGTHLAGLPRAACLGVSVTTGAACYCGLMWMCQPPALADLRRFAAPGREGRMARPRPAGRERGEGQGRE